MSSEIQHMSLESYSQTVLKKSAAREYFQEARQAVEQMIMKYHLKKDSQYSMQKQFPIQKNWVLLHRLLELNRIDLWIRYSKTFVLSLIRFYQIFKTIVYFLTYQLCLEVFLFCILILCSRQSSHQFVFPIFNYFYRFLFIFIEGFL